MPRSWRPARGIVATIDTGADFTHPGLAPSLIPGWDFVHNMPLGQEQADINTAAHRF